ncbi:unnamed protein product [Lymnaea stagnalis]|uniref:Saposin B-type domain-containing protein n=1 Tax=Lymnaea stagnalis TaxID=6523 RepID=A0AAV2HY97_LYMST
MANHSSCTAVNLTVFILSFFFMAVLVQSQGLSQDDDECGDCWLQIDDAIITVSDLLKDEIYRHRENDRLTENDVRELARRLPHHVFKRSAESSSFDCDSCWLVLERLKSLIKNSREREVRNLGQLVKRTMLNNGWA